MDKKLNLLSTFKSIKVNEDTEELTITGLANAQTIDRVGDIILEDAYKKGGLTNYLKNPIVLFNHDYGKPIGKATEVSVDASGLTITALISKAAGNVYDLIKDGIIKSFSVGFSIKDAEYDSKADILKITDIELYEVSAVAVPANADSIFNVSKQLSDLKQIKKEEFAQQSAKDSASAHTEEINMNELEKLQAELAKRDADLVAAEKMLDDAAKAEAAREKAAEEVAAAAKVTSQVENLIKDVEARFATKETEMKDALEGLQNDLKEKSSEIEKITRNKMSFQERGQGADGFSREEKEEAVLLSKLLGKDIKDTEFFKGLVQKSGLEHTPSAQWEQEFNTTIYNDVRDKLIVEPLFQTIKMQTPTMQIATNPEAGVAEWIPTSAFRSSDNSSTGTDIDHKLGETVLTAHKLASKEYIGYEEEEDTILPILPIIRDAVTRRMARASDQTLMRGDATVATGNGAGDVYPFDGLTTIAGDAGNNTTSVSVGAKWTVANLQSVRRELGVYGLKPGEVKYIVSQDVYYDLLEDPDFRTVDMVGTKATILSGQIGYVNGSIVVVSDSFLAKAATAPAVVAINTSNFYVGNLRTMMVERDKDIINQKRVLVATRRMGFLDMFAGAGVATGVWAV